MDKLKNMAAKAGLGSGSSNTDPNAANDKGDFLDQGVGMAGQRMGHNLDRNQQEQYSDQIRGGLGKAGVNVPFADKNVAGAPGAAGTAGAAPVAGDPAAPTAANPPA